MSSFDRRSVLLMPLALAACGFEPVHAPGGSGDALYGRIRVDAPEGVNTYLLVRRLEERLGRAQAPDYRLSVVLTVGSQGQAITASGDITFFSVSGTARYRLLRLADGAEVASGAVDNFTGYSATGTAAETLAAERDARERLMVILADQMARDLYMTADLSG